MSISEQEKIEALHKAHIPVSPKKWTFRQYYLVDRIVKKYHERRKAIQLRRIRQSKEKWIM